jgi:predicted choloylglycine hydrolase
VERIPFTFRAFAELAPGEKWRGFFEEMWPWYRRWYLQDGDEARPSYGTCVRMLRTHMPELLPTYERLVDLAGGGDLEARVLALYDPPPYLAACTQGVRAFDGPPVLVRNYDYSPSRLEGVVWSTAWNGRRVIGMGDCLWGLLDGLNDAGLAVSLTFGGRRVVGAGFGIPLVVRYLLETCAEVNEAVWALRHVPVNLAHNLTLVDRSGTYVTAHLAPDREPVFRETPVATNHQELVEWPEHANATRTVEREQQVLSLLEAGVSTEEFVAAFLDPALYSANYSRGFGTLYTAAYQPAEGRVDFLWPGEPPWTQSFHTEDARTQLLADAAVA